MENRRMLHNQDSQEWPVQPRRPGIFPVLDRLLEPGGWTKIPQEGRAGLMTWASTGARAGQLGPSPQAFLLCPRKMPQSSRLVWSLSILVQMRYLLMARWLLWVHRSLLNSSCNFLRKCEIVSYEYMILYNMHIYVGTQTCVPHIIVHRTPNYICKLQSFSNEKEYYFMEREIITFF